MKGKIITIKGSLFETFYANNLFIGFRVDGKGKGRCKISQIYSGKTYSTLIDNIFMWEID